MRENLGRVSYFITPGPDSQVESIERKTWSVPCESCVVAHSFSYHRSVYDEHAGERRPLVEDHRRTYRHDQYRNQPHRYHGDYGVSNTLQSFDHHLDSDDKQRC